MGLQIPLQATVKKNNFNYDKINVKIELDMLI